MYLNIEEGTLSRQTDEKQREIQKIVGLPKFVMNFL